MKNLVFKWGKERVNAIMDSTNKVRLMNPKTNTETYDVDDLKGAVSDKLLKAIKEMVEVIDLLPYTRTKDKTCIINVAQTQFCC